MNKKILNAIVLLIVFIFAGTSYAKTKNEMPIHSMELQNAQQYKSTLIVKNTESDTLIDESFEGDVETINQRWSFINNDGDIFDGEPNSWKLIQEDESFDVSHTGERGVGVYYNTDGCDDWFVTPQVELPASSEITFSFWARSHNASYLEDFNVMLSTGELAVSDFSVTLDEVVGTSSEWTQYSYDLSDYAGETIYLAVQCVSVDKWYLFADDFLLVAEGGGTEVAADFNADITIGSAPLTVNFSDQSTGATTWEWDFDNDGTVDNTEQNPEYTYQYIGDYTVSLTVSDGTNSDTETKTNYISVTSSDDAITSTTTGGKWGESSTWIGGEVPDGNDNVIINGDVVVKSTRYCNDLTVNEGKILQNWDYAGKIKMDGDLVNNGTIRNNPDEGGFDLVLEGNITNNGSIQNRTVRFEQSNSTITMGESADFTGVWIRGNKILAGSDLVFSNVRFYGMNYLSLCEFVLPPDSGYDLKMSGGYTENIKIDGNGNTLNMTDGAHLSDNTYLENIVLEGTVQVNNYDGDFVYFTGDSVIIEGNLQNTNGSADLEVEGVLNNNGVIRDNPDGDKLRIDLKGNLINNGTINNTEIEFDGSTDQTVKLNNSNNIDARIHFNAKIGSDDFQWYHDGSEISNETSYNLILDHLSVDEFGTYYCSTNEGNSRNIIVTGEGPSVQADFTADITSGTTPLTVNFTNLSTGNIDRYSWDFDADGIEDSDSQNPYYTFSEVGSYTVTLTVEDSDGNQDIETKENYITVSEPTEPVESKWTWLHPKPQGNHLYEASFVNGSVGYVGGDHGTLLKTTDAGETWTPLDIDTTSAVHGIHFLNQNVGFITGYGRLTNNSFILKTVDGGNSWIDLDVPTNDNYHDILFLDENNGFIVGNYGLVLKTTDGGSTWSEITSNTSESLLDVFFYNSSLGFAVGEDGVVIKTTDGGSTWSASTQGEKDLNRIYFPTQTVGYIVGDYGTLYKTVDGGNTWTDFSTSTIYSTMFDVYFSDENTGLVVGDGYIHKTTDGGNTWVRKDYNSDIDQKVIVPISTTDYLVFGEYGLMMESRDSGESWTFSFSEEYEELTAIDFANSLVGYAVADGDNVLKTIDGGNSWNPLTLDEYLNDVIVIDENIVIAVGTDGDVYKTTDGGQNWTTGGVSGYDDLDAISDPVGNTLFAVGQDTLILKSTDLGDSWVRIPSPINEEINLADVFFYNENNGIIVGRKKIFKTSDGGNTWTEISSPVDEYLNAIEFVNTSTGYIAGDDGTVLKTTDGGASWNQQTVNLETSYDDFTDIAFLDENNGFVVGDKGLVYQTSDGGSTWTIVKNITSNWLNSICIESGTAYIAGWGGTILSYEMEASTPSITADFSADITQGSAPLTVQFSDQSSDTPTSWKWDFDNDGSIDSEIQNPTYTYESVGTYTVKLTVFDDMNSDSKTKSNYITVTSNEEITSLAGKVTDATTGNPIQGATVSIGEITSTSDSEGNYLLENVPPGALTAEFIGTPTSGNVPLNVQFTDYSTNNTQTVTATNSGYTDYENRQVQIVEGQENNLDISMSPTLVPGAMRFVLSWDDDPRDLDSYLHTPEIDGSDYYVYYNSKGSADSPPYAVLDVDDTDGYGPETVTIHQTVSGTYKYYIHKYAGNQLLTESNAVVHIYNENGLLHTIQVPRSGDGDYWDVCELDGESQSISIINQIRSESPAAMNSKLLHAYRKAPQLVQNAQLALSYEWDFGDGATSTDQNPLHLYESPGLYTVTLKVSDGDKQNTLIKEDYINVTQMVTVTDTLLYESFEDDVSDWVIYDNDGDGASWGIYTEVAPYDTVAHTGERGLGVAWNSDGNDDWIVTPQIYLPDGDAINFYFWGHSHSSDYPEDFNVKLSTTGNDVEDFTVTLAEVRSAPLEWTEYAYNLDEYIGSNIYLAVQCVSVDKYYLWLDDFLVTSTGVTANDDLVELPTKFALYQNYPNPFNPSTTIVYDLPETKKVNLAIYNIRGEIVEQLVAGKQAAGQHQIIWQVENRATGVYFLKLTAGDYTSVKKIMYMK